MGAGVQGRESCGLLLGLLRVILIGHMLACDHFDISELLWSVLLSLRGRRLQLKKSPDPRTGCVGSERQLSTEVGAAGTRGVGKGELIH